MVLLVTLGLLVGVAILIGYPLFKSPSGDYPRKRAEDERLRELELHKESAYAALKELEFDFRTGKLSEEDYKELEEHHRYQALSLLKDIDRAEKGEDISEKIEEEIRAIRKAKAKELRCPYCQGTYLPGDRFCTSCGRRLDLACPGCGSPYREGDNYCSNCGKPLKTV